jgi:hypothetical protein
MSEVRAMADQYSGNMLVDLMHKVDKTGVPRPEVEIGGMIVNVGGLKVRIGPEGIEAFRRAEAEKQAAIASGKPFERGTWQTNDEAGKALMRAIAAAAGFPGIYD